MKWPGSNFTWLCFFEIKSSLFPSFRYSNSINEIYFSIYIFRFFLLKFLYSQHVSNLLPKGVSQESHMNFAFINLEYLSFSRIHIWSCILCKFFRKGPCIGKAPKFSLLIWYPGASGYLWENFVSPTIPYIIKCS